MTREEAKSMVGLLSMVTRGDLMYLNKVINKIYDDFERRTCSTCEYCRTIKEDECIDEYECDLEVEEFMSFNKGRVNADFGCNKWEEKEK